MKIQLAHWMKIPENMLDLKECEPEPGWNYYTLRLFTEVRIPEKEWSDYGLEMDDDAWEACANFVGELLDDYQYD